MKKIILFTLFLTFCAGAVYSETILNYKYNKKEEKKTPIEFVKIKKYSDNTYNVKYKIAIDIINSRGVLFFDRIDGNSNFRHKGYPLCYANSYINNKNNNSNFYLYMDGTKFYINDNYNCSSIGDIKFEFCFDNEENQFDDIKSSDVHRITQWEYRFEYYREKSYYEIARRNGDDYDTRIEELYKNNKINIINPVRIEYKYNKSTNSFDVTKTICYIDENGELKTKDIDITDSASYVVKLNEEKFDTLFYKNFKENKEKIRIAEENKKKEVRKKELFSLSEKIKNGQDISKYSEEDIKEAFEINFDAIGVYDQYFSNRAIFNIETNKNIYYQPIQILQVFPNKGMLGLVTANSFWLGSGAFVKTRPYYVYIDYKKTQNFVSDQFIEIYAKISGTYTYKTVSGGTNTVPKLKGYLVRKIKSYF